MGRPALGDDAKRHILTLRVTKQLRDRLAAAAEESGRSVAQEVEHRMERMLYDEHMRGLGVAGRNYIEMLAAGLATIQGRTGRSFEDDYPTWKAFRTYVDIVTDGFDPGFQGEQHEAAKHTGALIARAGEAEKEAERKLREAANLPDDLSGDRVLVHLLLGPEADRDEGGKAELGLLDDPGNFDSRRLEVLAAPLRALAEDYLRSRRNGERLRREAVESDKGAASLRSFNEAMNAANEALHAQSFRSPPLKKR